MNADPATFDVVLASAVGMNLNHQVRAIMTFSISTCGRELMSTTEEDMRVLLVTIERRPHKNQNTQQQPVRINMSMR